MRVTFDVPEETRAALVPALVLQPIVENAIRHGVEQREQAGRIVLQAARRADGLELTVTDNGPGLPTGAPAFTREGIGLSNTRSRLRHLYGDDQGLELQSAADGGLRVRLTLPFRMSREPERPPRSPGATTGGHLASLNA